MTFEVFINILPQVQYTVVKKLHNWKTLSICHWPHTCSGASALLAPLLASVSRALRLRPQHARSSTHRLGRVGRTWASWDTPSSPSLLPGGHSQHTIQLKKPKYKCPQVLRVGTPPLFVHQSDDYLKCLFVYTTKWTNVQNFTSPKFGQTQYKTLPATGRWASVSLKLCMVLWWYFQPFAPPFYFIRVKGVNLSNSLTNVGVNLN